MRLLKHLLWIVPLALLIGVAALMLRSAAARRAEDAYHAALPRTLLVHSSSFAAGGVIPTVYTCKGPERSPQLAWTNSPPGTRSFAVIVTDWDGPGPPLRLMPIVHWVLYNIPFGVRALSENQTMRGWNEGANISGGTKFAGPCPPFGTHAYIFHVYALDVGHLAPPSNDKAGLLQAMRGHILGYGELTAYRRGSDL